MSTALYPEGCTSPEMGCLLEDYLSGELAEDRVKAFEEHYFQCGACLEAIRVRQSGPHVLARWYRVAPDRIRYRWALLLAALLAIAAVIMICR